MDKKEYFRLYRERNREKLNLYSQAYYQNHKDNDRHKWQRENPEKARLAVKRCRDKNREKHNAYNREWFKHNAEKRSFYQKARQCLIARAMPKWLSSEQLEAIKTMYVNRPIGYHVDHDVPLNGKDVCGLHVPWNLKYLPAKENLSKGNKLSK